MVIFFNVEEPRRHLLAKGSVYTCRRAKRRQGGFMDARHGSLHSFERLGRVYVDFVMVVREKNDLTSFVYNSGFKTVDDWVASIDGEFPAYLYYVLLVE
jgi:hypothetical protein